MAGLRVVFFGTSTEYSRTPLAAIERCHRVVGIVESGPRGCTVPPAPSGLENAARALFGRPSLRMLAARSDVPFFYATKGRMGELADFLDRLRPDVCCIYRMSQLLPVEVLAIPRMGFVNLHPSLLPKFRGPNPMFWAYVGMESETGVTVHRLDPGEDTGDILTQRAFPMPLGLDPWQLSERSAREGAAALLEALDGLEAGTAVVRPQRELPCPQRGRNLKPGEVVLDWEGWALERVFHVLRASAMFQPGLLKRDLPGFLRWHPAGIERKAEASAPGRLGFDRRGFYFSHAEGRVRLGLALALPRCRPVVLGGWQNPQKIAKSYTM